MSFSPDFHNIPTLAQTINVSVNLLESVIINGIGYHSFKIPKRSGGHREIQHPEPNLASIQTAINTWFHTKITYLDCVHGFVPDRNILTNAIPHLRQQHVLNIDLKDYFSSVKAKQIYEIFQQNPFYLNHEMASLLTWLCTYEDRLPQGAPTSPTLANLATKPLDLSFMLFAKQHNLMYTRYADDITLSSADVMPDAVVHVENGQLKLHPLITRFVQENGFEINTRKVRLQTPSQRQEVTGIIVNEKPNVNRKFIKQIRAMLYDLKKNGHDQALAKHLTRRETSSQPSSLIPVIRGKIEFVGMVRGKDDLVYKKLKAELTNLARKISP